MIIYTVVKLFKILYHALFLNYNFCFLPFSYLILLVKTLNNFLSYIKINRILTQLLVDQMDLHLDLSKQVSFIICIVHYFSNYSLKCK